MKHCGKLNCAGASCDNWPKCRGETIPPWDCGPHTTTSKATVREQDILAAADELADRVTEYIVQGLVSLPAALNASLCEYLKARKGER